jgi:hypothetical protein
VTDDRRRFSATEWIALRVLVKQRGSAAENDQKRLRGGLRGLGFYLRDFEKAGRRCWSAALESLLDNGTLRIYG